MQRKVLPVLNPCNTKRLNRMRWASSKDLRKGDTGFSKDPISAPKPISPDTWTIINQTPTGTYLDGVWSLDIRIKSICFDIFSGWWFQPLWKIWKSVGMMKSPIYRKIKLMFQTINQFLMCLVLSTYFNHLNSPSRISLWNPKWSDSAGWTCQWPVPAFRPRWRSPGGRGGHFMGKNIEASLQDGALQWWLLVYNPHEKYSYL